MDKLIETFRFFSDTVRYQYPGFDFELKEFTDIIVIRCRNKCSGRVENYAIGKRNNISSYMLLSIAKKLVNKLGGPIDYAPIDYATEYCKNDIIATKDAFDHMNGIKNVIFSEPATIVFFNDGTKEVVKCSDDDEYNPAAGIAFCVMKRYFGKNYHHELRKWMKKYDAEQDDWRDCSKRIADALVNLFKASEMEENIDDGSE